MVLESAPMELIDRHLQEAFPGATDFGARIQADERCTIERTLDVIGGKWATLILRELFGGTRRFGELRGRLTGVSPKTLTDRLRELEAHGVVSRAVYAEVPPRVEYTLTEKGRALWPILEAMGAWGERWT